MTESLQEHREAAPPEVERYLNHAHGEVILPDKTVPVTVKPLERHPSAIKSLLQLTGAERTDLINEPSVASRHTEANEGNKLFSKYEVLFGRDSLIVAGFLIDWSPRLMRSTITTLAKLQARGFDPAKEAEPGKIPHEVRDPNSERAQELTEKNGWGWPYYGSIDSTLRYVNAVHAYWEKADRGELDESGSVFLNSRFERADGQEDSIFQSVRKAVDWIRFKMAENPEGFVEFRRTGKHHGNESWRDSHEGYPRKNGDYADNTYGIASVEVQALTYDSLIGAADIFEAVADEPGTSNEYRSFYLSEAMDLRQRAQRLRERVIDNMWVEDGERGYFALGTERESWAGSIKVIDVKTSNMGHLLNSAILDGDEYSGIRDKLVRTLFSSEMLSPNGIRTLASDEVAFAPFKYHDGSVWLWEQQYIALGLDRHGYHEQARLLRDKVRQIIAEEKIFPEFVSGSDEGKPRVASHIYRVLNRKYGFEYGIQKGPQEIQAWSVAADLAIKAHYGWKLRAEDIESAPIRELSTNTSVEE